MIKIMLLAASVSLIAISAQANNEPAYPKDSKHMRMERRSGAHNKAVGQSLNKQGINGQDCYYRMSGCSEEVKNQPAGQYSVLHKPSAFPKDGYALGSDGLYHYKSGLMSRK